jgi:hypothetical protein
LKEAYERYLNNLVFDKDSPEFWYGLTGIPVKPLVPEDAGQAHDFAIKLTAHIYGKWISVQGLVKPPGPRVGSSLGRSLEEPEEGSGEDRDEDQELDEYLTDIADSNVEDDDDDFDEYYRNMRSAEDGVDYSSDQESDQLAEERPVIQREKQGWRQHGGRRQRDHDIDEGLEGGSEDRQRKRKRTGVEPEERRSKAGRLEPGQEIEADMAMDVER